MSATTIAPYGRHGQKDVCFCRMLKKAASRRRSSGGLCCDSVRQTSNTSADTGKEADQQTKKAHAYAPVLFR